MLDHYGRIKKKKGALELQWAVNGVVAPVQYLKELCKYSVIAITPRSIMFGLHIRDTQIYFKISHILHEYLKLYNKYFV